MKLNKREIGYRIKRHRMELGLSQKQFSEMLGISRNHLSGIETGKYLITTSVLIKLYTLYGKTPDYYLIGRISPTVSRLSAVISELNEDDQKTAIKILAEYVNQINTP